MKKWEGKDGGKEGGEGWREGGMKVREEGDLIIINPSPAGHALVCHPTHEGLAKSKNAILQQLGTRTAHTTGRATLTHPSPPLLSYHR